LNTFVNYAHRALYHWAKTKQYKTHSPKRELRTPISDNTTLSQMDNAFY